MLYNKKWDQNQNPVSKLLRDGADHMEKHGHTKGQLQDDNGSVCFLGALYAARGRMNVIDGVSDVTDIVQSVMNIPFHRNGSVYAMVAWNNAPERTGEEVIAAMRLAADYAETKETADAV